MEFETRDILDRRIAASPNQSFDASTAPRVSTAGVGRSRHNALHLDQGQACGVSGSSLSVSNQNWGNPTYYPRRAPTWMAEVLEAFIRQFLRQNREAAAAADLSMRIENPDLHGRRRCRARLGRQAFEYRLVPQRGEEGETGGRGTAAKMSATPCASRTTCQSDRGSVHLQPADGFITGPSLDRRVLLCALDMVRSWPLLLSPGEAPALRTPRVGVVRTCSTDH